MAKPVIYLALDEEQLQQIVDMYAEKLSAASSETERFLLAVAAAPYADALRKVKS